MTTVRPIPNPQVSILDPNLPQLVAKDWYDYFQNVEERLFEQNLYRLSVDPTRIWIDIVAGSDVPGKIDKGIKATTAWQTPQAAVNHIIKHWHLNNMGVEFFYRWRDDGSGNPIEYPGAIWAYPFLGSPHDFAIRVVGEKDGGGNIRVRIADGVSGCIHAAEGAQVYVSDIAARATTAGVSAFKAAYNGKIFLDNVIIYSGGGSMIEAGPRGGSIDVNGNISIIKFGTATNDGLTNSLDGGAISSAAGKTWTLIGSPIFAFGMINGSTRGRQELRHTWSGTATGRKWTMQSDAMFLTAGGPGAANLDAWVPGTIAGLLLDGGSVAGTWPIL